MVDTVTAIKAPATINPDADLIELDEMLSIAQANCDETFERNGRDEATAGESDAAYRLASLVVDKIEGTPAKTLQGLRVKAKAVMWCHGKPWDRNKVQLTDDPTTDMRLAQSIVHDLVNMDLPAA